MGGDEADDSGGRINLARQNADDRHFVLVGKNVAEVEHADVNVAAEEPFLCGAHGAGAPRTGGGKANRVGGIGGVVGTDLTFSRDLVGDGEVLNFFGRALPGRVELGGLL